MSNEYIALLMFSTLMLMLVTGQRVFGAVGFVASVSALLLWGGTGAGEMPFNASIGLLNWYPLLTLPCSSIWDTLLPSQVLQRSL